MIDLAFGILAVAALVGSGLAIVHARGPGAKIIGRTVPTIHAVIGTVGLAVLIAALRLGASAASERLGTAGFGTAAAGLVALAFLVGLLMASRAWRRKPPGGALIGIHATLAIAGVTLLLALVALG
ncbi:MAG TPA: hypothetical protein VID77_05275 [Stellaceae bacterium]|jgi:hypothetical protein